MQILNSKGQPVVLNEKQARIAEGLTRYYNSLGFEVDITTLTTITQMVTEQKFYQVAFADYVPVRIGNGAWSTNLLTYRAFSLADDFSTGLINTGNANDRLAAADAGVDSLTIPVNTWAKSIGWTIPELQEASKSGNWDLVTQKEISRKTNWDLGLQRTAFIGNPGSTSTLGLLNQADVTFDTSLLSGPISALTATPSTLSTFLKNLLNKYRTNSNSSAWPTHLVVPESDFLGFMTPSSPDFPLKSLMELMLESLVAMTGNKNFKILPSRYADVATSEGQLTKQTYALYNSTEQTIRMDVPVDYTVTVANSLNNFQYQNVGYGQFTGVKAYRPQEVLYFGYTP